MKSLKRGWGQPYPEHNLFTREVFEPRELSVQLRVREDLLNEGKYYWCVSPHYGSMVKSTASMKEKFVNPRDAMDKADEHYRKELKRLKEAA